MTLVLLHRLQLNGPHLCSTSSRHLLCVLVWQALTSCAIAEETDCTPKCACLCPEATTRVAPSRDTILHCTSHTMCRYNALLLQAQALLGTSCVHTCWSVEPPAQMKLPRFGNSTRAPSSLHQHRRHTCRPSRCAACILQSSCTACDAQPTAYKAWFPSSTAKSRLSCCCPSGR